MLLCYKDQCFAILSVVALLQLPLAGCVQETFQYTETEPFRLENLNGQSENQKFENEGHGTLWTSCQKVNTSAVAQLLASAKDEGYDGVANLEWYLDSEDKWVKKPSCVREFGWLAGWFCTIWWPSATKVVVRGHGLRIERDG